MKSGDIVELIEDMTFYKKGRKAHVIRGYAPKPSSVEIVWFGEEDAYKQFGDTEIVPKRILRVQDSSKNQEDNYYGLQR